MKIIAQQRGTPGLNRQEILSLSLDSVISPLYDTSYFEILPWKLSNISKSRENSMMNPQAPIPQL